MNADEHGSSSSIIRVHPCSSVVGDWEFAMDSTIRVTRDADNIATVWIDLPGKSVNTVTPQVLTDLDAALTQLAADPKPAGVIFASAKKGNFVAGADLF